MTLKSRMCALTWCQPPVTSEPFVQFPQRRAIAVPPEQPGSLCIRDPTIMRVLPGKCDHETVVETHTEGSLGDHVQVGSPKIAVTEMRDRDARHRVQGH